MTPRLGYCIPDLKSEGEGVRALCVGTTRSTLSFAENNFPEKMSVHVACGAAQHEGRKFTYVDLIPHANQEGRGQGAEERNSPEGSRRDIIASVE